MILLTPLLFTSVVSCENKSSVSDNSVQDSSSVSSYENKDSSDDQLPSDYFKNYCGNEEGKLNSKVSIIDYDNYKTFDKYEAYVDGTKAALYSVKTDTSHSFSIDSNQREDSSVLQIRMEGKADIAIKLSYSYNSVPTIRPIKSSISCKVDSKYNLISFTVFNKGQYTIEFNDSKTPTMHLFVDSLTTDYSSLKDDDDVIFFSKGIHNSSNDSRINSNNEINVPSNKKVVVDYGGIIEAKFVSYNQSNISLIGGGIIDLSSFKRDSNSRAIPVDFSYCTNVTISDLSFLDPAGWCLNLYFDNHVSVDNVKIISSRANGDGISVQSCSNVEVTDSFVRTYDDSLVVKNYPKYGNYSLEGSTKSVHFTNCLIWNDLAQGMEIGYEAIGKTMDDISFKDITVLHAYHKAPISIHNGNNADITNVKFENITIEDASMGQGDGSNALIGIECEYSPTWSDNWKTTSLGSISNVKIKNVLVRSDNNKNLPIVVKGSYDSRDKTSHYVSGIYLTDISINGSVLDGLNKNISTNSYVKGFYVSSSGDEITGASLKNCSSLDQVNSIYSDYCDFI